MNGRINDYCRVWCSTEAWVLDTDVVDFAAGSQSHAVGRGSAGGVVDEDIAVVDMSDGSQLGHHHPIIAGLLAIEQEREIGHRIARVRLRVRAHNNEAGLTKISVDFNISGGTGESSTEGGSAGDEGE